MMNQIKAKIDKSDYEGYADFLNIQIDGDWLDEYLDHISPNRNILGTIPTLSFGMMNPKEERVVWERILPNESSITACPILMCPDDCDFWCICVVAEIENYKGRIFWKRIGLDKSDIKDPRNVGEEVEWIPNMKFFDFDLAEYLAMIDAFKRQYEIDKADWERRNREFQEELKK